jgi:uncharacterized protein with HEPN domain
LKRDPRDYIEHIDECLRYVATWVEDGRDVFLTDVRTRAASIRMLQELSESVRRLDPLLRQQYPEFPWRDVIGFRNVLVHDYLGLNLERIWEIASEHVPLLRPQVDQMLADLDRPHS